MISMAREGLDEVQQTMKMGANAVIGLTLDFGNVGAKNKSLLMTYAKGTAVLTELGKWFR